MIVSSIAPPQKNVTPHLTVPAVFFSCSCQPRTCGATFGPVPASTHPRSSTKQVLNHLGQNWGMSWTFEKMR